MRGGWGGGREGEGIGIKLNCKQYKSTSEKYSVHILINVIISMTVKRLSQMIGEKEAGPHVGVGSPGFLVIMRHAS